MWGMASLLLVMNGGKYKDETKPVPEFLCCTTPSSFNCVRTHTSEEVSVDKVNYYICSAIKVTHVVLDHNGEKCKATHNLLGTVNDSLQGRATVHVRKCVPARGFWVVNLSHFYTFFVY